MQAFQIVIDRRPNTAAPQAFSSLRGVVDVLVDGSNVTARIGQDLAIPMLRDLAYAAGDMATRRHRRTTVRFYDQRDAWALGLERVDDEVLVTVFQTGTQPSVAVHEKSVAGVSLLRGMLTAIDNVLQSNEPQCLSKDLEAARQFLTQVTWQSSSHIEETIEVRVEPQSEAPISFSSEFDMRVHLDELVLSEVERNDLHSLLVRGRCYVRVGEVCRSLGDAYPFLLAETLVREATEVLSAWEAGKSLNHRHIVADLMVATRLTSSGVLALTFGSTSTGGFHGAPTFPSVSVPSFVEAVLSFSRGLIRPILRNDSTQRNNLRMRVFREDLRALKESLREAVREDTKLNEFPESYRAFAATLPQRKEGGANWRHGKIRYQATWQAAVPGIDLHSVFLFGDRLLVAGSRELAAIERRAGKLLWRKPIERGVSIAAPNGLIRLSSQGTMHFHDLSTGDVMMTTRLTGRTGGMPAGAVVNAPGLPQLVLLSEGERHISAVDYVSGEVRWRHALGRGRSFKVRRAGKLLVVSSSEQSLTALDVSTGETVWRVRDRLKFVRPVSYEDNDLFAVAGEGGSPHARSEVLLSLDPWTGKKKWSQDLPRGLRTVGAPMLLEDNMVIAMQDRRGLGLFAFDRQHGRPIWNLAPGFAPSLSSFLAVQDTLIINSDNGSVCALDGSDGTIRWRRVTEAHLEGDVPRNMEPVLRNGLVFVPQRKVMVLRPNDGERLGEVEVDLVPDLIRVDDDCHVLVVEESGHLAAFSAGARLSLVKG